MTTKKYPVKMNYRFNLDSMYTHVENLIYDMEDGTIKGSVELMGKQMDIDDLENFKKELEDLIGKSWYPVCGKDYGRIKEISDARNTIRYATCMSKGMNESNAALAFFD